MEDFKSWEEMTVLEQMQCQYWDMYKDAYGMRPRGIDTSSWTEAEFLNVFEQLAEVIQREEVQRQTSEAEAAVRFEEHLAVLMSTGARTRENAIAWVHEAEGSNGDDEYLCFLLGLRYGYFRKAA
jgi:hypothetical protein